MQRSLQKYLKKTEFPSMRSFSSVLGSFQSISTEVHRCCQLSRACVHFRKLKTGILLEFEIMLLISRVEKKGPWRDYFFLNHSTFTSIKHNNIKWLAKWANDTFMFSSITILSSNLNIWMTNNNFPVCHIFQHETGRAIKTNTHQVKLSRWFVITLTRSYSGPIMHQAVF